MKSLVQCGAITFNVHPDRTVRVHTITTSNTNLFHDNHFSTNEKTNLMRIPKIEWLSTIGCIHRTVENKKNVDFHFKNSAFQLSRLQLSR